MSERDETGSMSSGTGSSDELDARQGISGDRGIPSVNRVRSLQARVSNALAIALMGGIGVGMLSWYYAHAIGRERKAQSADAVPKPKVQGEMVLPALGRVDAPLVQTILGPEPPLPSDEEFGVRDVAGAAGAAGDRYAAAPSYASNGISPQVDPALERRLKAAAYVAGNVVGAEGTVGAPAMAGASAGGGSELENLLRPAVLEPAAPSVLPMRRLLLPKGSFIDCTLETALDSTLPGMATCVTASDTFSADGKVVLIERGTKLVGETRGAVRQGAARLFVLWSEARLPDGVVVPLASPGTDELGRAGLPGEVDRHFWERFGAAILISLIDGAVQAAAQPSGDGTVIYNPSSSQDIVTEVLRSTVNIPPTIRKPQGDRIQVLVARDIDFRSVYRLRAVASADSGTTP